MLEFIYFLFEGWIWKKWTFVNIYSSFTVLEPDNLCVYLVTVITSRDSLFYWSFLQMQPSKNHGDRADQRSQGLQNFRSSEPSVILQQGTCWSWGFASGLAFAQYGWAEQCSGNSSVTSSKLKMLKNGLLLYVLLEYISAGCHGKIQQIGIEIHFTANILVNSFYLWKIRLWKKNHYVSFISFMVSTHKHNHAHFLK